MRPARVCGKVSEVRNPDHSICHDCLCKTPGVSSWDGLVTHVDFKPANRPLTLFLQ